MPNSELAYKLTENTSTYLYMNVDVVLRVYTGRGHP